MLQSCFKTQRGLSSSSYRYGIRVAAVIDGSHLSIKCPPGGREAMRQCHNFKNFYSVLLLALVDSKCLVIWTPLGASGKTHDSKCLFHKIKKGNVLPEKFQFIGNTKIPSVIFGDGAFPMKPWMCKPFGDALLTWKKSYFNYRLNHARKLSEGALVNSKVDLEFSIENVKTQRSL